MVFCGKIYLLACKVILSPNSLCVIMSLFYHQVAHIVSCLFSWAFFGKCLPALPFSQFAKLNVELNEYVWSESVFSQQLCVKGNVWPFRRTLKEKTEYLNKLCSALY